MVVVRSTIASGGRGPAGTPAGGLALTLQGSAKSGWRRAMPQFENDRVVESTTEARAGVTGHNVRYVLVVSTLAVIGLFAIVVLWFFA